MRKGARRWFVRGCLHPASRVCRARPSAPKRALRQVFIVEQYVTYTPVVAGVGLLGALGIYASLSKLSAGNDRMKEIAEAIEEGAIAFLKREYTYLAVFIIAVTGLLFFFRGWETAA